MQNINACDIFVFPEETPAQFSARKVADRQVQQFVLLSLEAQVSVSVQCC